VAGAGRPWRSAGLAFLAGGVAGLGHVPYGLPLLALTGFAALFWLAAGARGWRGAAARMWAGGTGCFAVTLFWIVEPFFVDAARHGWMAPFAIVLLTGGLALFWAGAGALGHALAVGPASRAPTIAVALVLAGFGRTYLFTGFPWVLPGYVWSETPVAQLASLGGVHGLSMLTLLAAALPVALLRARDSWPRRFAALGLATLPIVAAGVWGAARLSAPLDLTETRVRVVQPNAAQHLKWRPDMIPVFFSRALELTATPADPPPDLIVWPETSVPDILSRAGPAFAAMRAAAGPDAVIVAGLQRREAARFYNSLAVLAPGTADPWDHYDKHHLVPFGEYLPYAAFWARFGLDGLAANVDGGFRPGPGPQIVTLPGIGPALPLICYEAVFPQDVFRAPARPALLLHATNDAWFGDFAGPYQHLAQARLRAIEQGLPMVRAANTGVSAIIGPRGRVLVGVPLGEAATADAPLPAALPPTPYAIHRDSPVFALTLLLLGLAALARLIGKKAVARPDIQG
jgi:apolipoprotein N-acyltransferase